jgi:hypothetical protein
LFGQCVPLIKGEVYKFAEEAIEYIGALVEVAGEEPTAKEDLKSIWYVLFHFSVPSWMLIHLQYGSE